MTRTFTLMFLTSTTRGSMKKVFHKGNFAGTFQFTESWSTGSLRERVKPNNIIDIAAITSIYRPGPLSANVDKDFINAK